MIYKRAEGSAPRLLRIRATEYLVAGGIKDRSVLITRSAVLLNSFKSSASLLGIFRSPAGSESRRSDFPRSTYRRISWRELEPSGYTFLPPGFLRRGGPERLQELASPNPVASTDWQRNAVTREGSGVVVRGVGTLPSVFCGETLPRGCGLIP